MSVPNARIKSGGLTHENYQPNMNENIIKVKKLCTRTHTYTEHKR